MGAFWQDLRYAFRMLSKSPGFTAVAVLTLGLGIGGNAAIFSVVNSVLLRPLPYKNPEQLVKVTSEFTKLNQHDLGLSVPELQDLQRDTQLFQGVVGMISINCNLTGGERPARVESVLHTANYFSVLGVNAAMGRVFGPQDDEPGIGTVAVLSDGAWKRRFGADPNIIGKQIRVDDDLYTVVGIMPPNFRHPGKALLSETELWGPTGFAATPFPDPPVRAARFLQGAIARLQPGVTVAMAQAQLESLSNALLRQYPDSYTGDNGWTLRVTPLQQELTGNVRPALLVLLAVVGFVLLIACVNVANLLLARAGARQGEIAVRLALGATRYRLLRQLLVESLLLSFLGAALGLVLAFSTFDFLVRLIPADLLQTQVIQMDRSVLWFGLGICVLTAILFGLVPALSASGANVQETLRQTGLRATSGVRSNRIGAALVVLEFAMALMLVIGAVLLVRSFWNLATMSPGFRPQQIQTASVWLPSPNDPTAGAYYTPEQKAIFYRKVLERLRNLPGVEEAAATDVLPLVSARRFVLPIKIQGRRENFGELGFAAWGFGSSEYLHVMGIPLLRGRNFSDADDLKSQRVAIVDEAFARKFFPSQDPIGQQIQVPPGVFGFDRNYQPWYTIVGIAGNVKDNALDAIQNPMVYSPLAQDAQFNLSFAMRIRPGFGNPSALVDSVAREVHAVDPEVPVYGPRTMDEIVSRALSSRRFSMQLLVLFAALALVLSAVGIYGVVKFFVSQRTHEIGIRMALGAQPRDVLRQVFSFGATMALWGVGIGLAAALVVTRWLSGLLYGVRSTDPLTFVAAPLLLTLVALLACYLPARRAMRVDPIVVLRYE
ncbi:MAG TPA: ABC transporter permease [Candidatus Sulfotelmatobacter sp.]|nr:ABC transporter permease [Candidatus Sulfotelmatobacter sp.]